MKALTLRRPWCWAICHGGKDCENRTWRPPASVLGERIAIHSGLRWDDDGCRFLVQCHAGGTARKSPPLLPAQWPGGRIVATAVVRTCVQSDVHYQVYRDTRGPWFTGPYGWILSDVRVLCEPVPCRGAQRLWTLPPDIEARVLGQEQEARART